jgi:hypothetical protein
MQLRDSSPYGIMFMMIRLLCSFIITAALITFNISSQLKKKGLLVKEDACLETQSYFWKTMRQNTWHWENAIENVITEMIYTGQWRQK